jgi:putative transposase
VKRAFKYRFYPTPGQATELARTFGCVRLVYNMALAARTEAWTQRRERVTYNATSAMLTGWKKTDGLAFLNDVSCVPLQQALRHLQVAFTNFWAKRARYPTFKSRKRSRRSAEYTASAFRWRDGRLTLAKIRSVGHRLVAAAPAGCGAVHGDGDAGRGGPLVHVPALRRRDRAGPGLLGRGGG